jgi:hypothetical protein
LPIVTRLAAGLFAESDPPPDDRVDEEVSRLAAILDQPLRASIRNV